ncbi:MAG: extracellular solute-binding protein [Phycisphaera sp.]|nr:MAG: extracellular solute-binding protein [Phycisphaera sp.]
MRTELRRICTLSLGIAIASLAGCSNETEPAESADGSTAEGPRVVLYTSADDYLLKEVVAEFEKRTGIEVLEVGDTEATKTVGLYARLGDEKDAPRADVWWSSEPFYTIRLANEGVLEPYTSESGEQSIPGGWPEAYRGADGMWYGIANRARVIAYDTRKLTAEQVPAALRDLAEPQWEGKVGMARPTFGTTVGHVATLVHLWGEEPTRQWLQAMEANGLRLYDGNSSVVRAIANGEIELGLTDTDDVWAAQAAGMPVDLVYEVSELDSGASPSPDSVFPMMSFGALTIPNTVARVAGGPNPEEAQQLIDFLISEAGERLIMASDSRNVPIRELAAEELYVQFPRARIEPAARVDLEAVADEIETARSLVEDVFGL